MASVDVIRSCLDSIRPIGDEIADAILYLDAGCLEAFRFMGAFPLLLELGVRAVCSLENMSPLDITTARNSTSANFTRKMVVITSRLLSDAHRYILHCLDIHQAIRQCIIFTSISEIAHSAYADSPLGPDAFREYESLLLQDYEELATKHEKQFSPQINEIKQPAGYTHETVASQSASSVDYDFNAEAGSVGTFNDDDSISCLKTDGSKRLLVSVNHFSMVMCPLSPQVFILPSEGAVAEACLSYNTDSSLSPGLPSMYSGRPSDGEDVPPGVTLTAHFLYHMAAKLDLKMEIFSLGDTSNVIGKMLTDMSSLYDVGRRTKRSAGLLLIDRTQDLLTPCSHGDSFLDRLLSSLPRVDRTSSTFNVKSSQNPGKHFPANVQRAPLDVKVPFETVFSKEEPAMSSTHLSESITAFMSGWKSTDIDPETATLDDCGDTVCNHPSSDTSLLNGTLLSNYVGTTYMEALFKRGANDGATVIKRWLMEALKHNKVALSTRSRPSFTSASELHDLVTKLASSSASIIRNRDIIQLVLAAEIALAEPNSSHWDALTSAEKILSISSADTSQSLSSQIRDLIHTSTLMGSSEGKSMESPQALLSFKDALLLSMIGYILAGENFPTSGSSGPFSWEEENSLKEAVVDAILEKPKSAKLNFLHGLEEELEYSSRNGGSIKHQDVSTESCKNDEVDDWGNWDDDDEDQHTEQAYGAMQLKLELQDRVDNLFRFFHKLSGLKWRNPTVREGPAASANYDNNIHRKSFLHKLLMAALNKYDIPGLEYHSSAVGRFLKSGLGRFGLGQAKPNFGDQNVLLVFVVGGVSSVEVQEAFEAFSECNRPESDLILGGTTLLTPDYMFELLLGSSSYT